MISCTIYNLTITPWSSLSYCLHGWHNLIWSVPEPFYSVPPTVPISTNIARSRSRRIVRRRRRRERRETLHTGTSDSPGPGSPRPTWRPPSLTIGPTFINLMGGRTGERRPAKFRQFADLHKHLVLYCIFLCLGALFSRMTNKFPSAKSLSRVRAVHWLGVRHYVMASRQFRQVSGYIWSKFVPAAQFIFWPRSFKDQPIMAQYCLPMSNEKSALFQLDQRVAEIM